MSSPSNSRTPDNSQDPRFETPFSLSSSMRGWRSRLQGRNSQEQSTNSNLSQLEAGLTYHNLSDTQTPEGSEDIGELGLSSLTHETKSDANRLSADAPRVSTSSSLPTDSQIEKIPTTIPEPDDTTPRTQRKWSVSVPGFLKRSKTGIQADSTGNEGENMDEKDQNDKLKKTTTGSQPPPEYTAEARHVVESFNVPSNDYETKPRSGTETPSVDRHLYDSDYVPAPDKYKPSIFGAILTSKLHDIQETSQQHQQQYQTTQAQTQPKSADYLDLARRAAPAKPKHQRFFSHDLSVPSSGAATPSKKPKWYEQPEHASSLANMLVQAGLSSTSPAVPETPSAIPRSTPPHKPSGMIATAVDMIQNGGRRKSGSKHPSRYDVVAEVADIIARRRYLIKLCGAFMQYGAPTHRIEEYLAASARALLIDAQFMYIPGAMMCTFIDSTIQSNSVELVRNREALDFGRLKDVFNVYKLVIHEKYTAEDGIAEIENIRKRPDPYGIWFRIFVFGMASVIVGPFSFSSRPIDFAPIFAMGCALGFLQLKVVPRSEQFSNVFEVSACVLAAFIARGLGSIKWPGDGGYVFCFSAVAQSSIAMILPGFMVLNSALELQGRSIVAGSVRMVYAIIYVLFLGFGLLVGTTVFGLIKRDATSDVTCSIPSWWSPAGAGQEWRLIYTRFIWAPMFACCVGLIYRAKWRQLPVMALIAACGHQANFWISTQLSSNLQVANAVGAFVIGCLANLYSRLFHGLAAAAMLPAIYCQVPGGLASSGSLVAGINSSNQIFGNSSSVSVINNGTQGFVAAQDDPSSVYGGTIFNVGYGMVQVAIGISVGLYLSALVVYPYGKRNSGLFSF